MRRWGEKQLDRVVVVDIVNNMDVKTLYNMVKVVAERVERTLQGSGGQNYNCVGYPGYVEEYNRLAPLVRNEFGKEAEGLFPQIDLGKHIDPYVVIREYGGDYMWRTYLERAAVHLDRLVAYLRSKLGGVDEEVLSIIDLIRQKLRPSMPKDKDPKEEKDVNDILEVIFNARDLSYERDKVTISYSTKSFRPDFVFESLDLAVEVKLCTKASREKEIIGEINEDIPPYKKKYSRIIFVVYDLGFIADVPKFKSGIETEDIHVVVVKK